MNISNDLKNGKTKLDILNDQYWLEFNQGQAIDGGLAYESQLRQCNLNLSLGSLKDIDRLLSSIRKDIQAKFAKSDKQLSVEQQKTLLFNQDSFRKLALFIAFYTGRVLTKIYQSHTHCLSQQELSQIGSHFISADVEHSLAIRFVDGSKQQQLHTSQVARISHPELFFVYEPMLMRLFGSFDYQLRSIQGQPQVADGLYRAVMERLPKQLVNQAKAPVSSSPHLQTTLQTTPQVVQQPIQTANSSVTQARVHNSSSAPNVVNNTSSTTSGMPISSPKPVSPISIDGQNEQGEYLDLLSELDSYVVNQFQGEQEYAQGKKVMNQFDEHARKQGKPTAELSFPEQHVKARQHALDLINKAANYGNTTAMLHLAVYYLRGDWLPEDTAKGVGLIENAANVKDPRAMRELSRLYYQGIGLAQNSAKGKYWIEQAAESGHPEAKKVVNQMMMAQVLMDDYKTETTSDQRYLYFFIGLFVFILLVLIFL